MGTEKSGMLELLFFPKYTTTAIIRPLCFPHQTCHAANGGRGAGCGDAYVPGEIRATKSWYVRAKWYQPTSISA